MKVFLNHQEIFVGSRAALRDLLVSQSINSNSVSVAVNNRIITKEEWASTMLADGDKVTVMTN
ncbi:MAG: sulfur carrier protein ThiS [Bacteroidales bacterium]|nr:sulfur carrier protein ThiS [Bacteroidales bacterium]